MTQQELYAAAAAHADSTLVERLRERRVTVDVMPWLRPDELCTEAADRIDRLEAALLLIAIPRVGGGQWASEIAKKVMHIGEKED